MRQYTVMNDIKHLFTKHDKQSITLHEPAHSSRADRNPPLWGMTMPHWLDSQVSAVRQLTVVVAAAAVVAVVVAAAV